MVDLKVKMRHRSQYQKEGVAKEAQQLANLDTNEWLSHAKTKYGSTWKYILKMLSLSKMSHLSKTI